MKENMKEKLKGLKQKLGKKVYLTGKVYYIILFAIPILGLLVKNMLLQGYINGENLYSPNFAKAISLTWKYWIFYVAIAVLILSIGAVFKKEKIRSIYIFICNFMFTVLVCCDVVYIRSFFTMPSAADALILKNFSGFDGGEVTSLLCAWDMLLFIDILLLAVFLVVFRRKETNEVVRLKRLRKAAVVAAAFSVIILVAIPLQANALAVNKDAYNEIYGEDNAEKTSAYFSSLGFHIKDIYELVTQMFHSELTEDEQQTVDTYYEWKNENLPDNEYAGMFEGKNVLFLQIESLESFGVGQTIEGQEITPNINKLVEKSFYFSNVFEQVQGGNSSDADLMYTTSRLPVSKGSTFFRYEDVKLTSFPGYLRGLGYDTLYTQAVEGSFWNYQNCWSKMIGVDNFIGADDINMDYEKIGFTINDEDFINETYPYIGEVTAPYYAHIVLNSSHMPFEAEEKYRNLDLPEELDDTYLGGYLQLVNYVDKCIGELLGRMEADGLLENTVIVVIGDHTGIHKYYEYSLEEWYDEYPWVNVEGNYVVPFIISSDDMEETYESDVLAGQIDVMPTLAYLFGMPEEQYINDAMGRNLLKTNRSYAIFRDGTIHGELTDEEKAIVSTSYDVSELLFEVGK